MGEDDDDSWGAYEDPVLVGTVRSASGQGLPEAGDSELANVPSDESGRQLVEAESREEPSYSAVANGSTTMFLPRDTDRLGVQELSVPAMVCDVSAVGLDSDVRGFTLDDVGSEIERRVAMGCDQIGRRTMSALDGELLVGRLNVDRCGLVAAFRDAGEGAIARWREEWEARPRPALAMVKDASLARFDELSESILDDLDQVRAVRAGERERGQAALAGLRESLENSGARLGRFLLRQEAAPVSKRDLEGQRDAVTRLEADLEAKVARQQQQWQRADADPDGRLQPCDAMIAEMLRLDIASCEDEADRVVQVAHEVHQEARVLVQLAQVAREMQTCGRPVGLDERLGALRSRRERQHREVAAAMKLG